MLISCFHLNLGYLKAKLKEHKLHSALTNVSENKQNREFGGKQNAEGASAIE
jgi:hypothetical protein